MMGPYSAMVKSINDTFSVGDEVYFHVADENLYFFGVDGQRIRQSDSGAYKKMRIMTEGLSDV